MVQNTGGTRFVLEALQHVAAARAVYVEPHGLQRQRASDVGIGRPIHDSHGALAKLSGYYVAPNLFGSHRVLIASSLSRQKVSLCLPLQRNTARIAAFPRLVPLQVTKVP